MTHFIVRAEKEYLEYLVRSISFAQMQSSPPAFPVAVRTQTKQHDGGNNNSNSNSKHTSDECKIRFWRSLGTANAPVNDGGVAGDDGGKATVFHIRR
jgi:hypothetical protein